MRASTVFFVFVLLSVCINGQSGDFGRTYIDDFSLNQFQGVEIKLSTSINPSSSITEQDHWVGTNCGGRLIGCARDMIMTATQGDIGRGFSSQIFPSSTSDPTFTGEWAISNPKGGASVSTIQYDGPDSSSTLNTNGLNGYDMREGNLARGFRFFLLSDLPTSLTITVYDTASGVSSASVTFPQDTLNEGDNISKEKLRRDISFTAFSGNANLNSVGAITLEVPSIDAVDAFVRTLRIFGDPDPSPSRTGTGTGTQTPPPTQSRTPAPSPTQTRTPTPPPSQSQTPSPPPSQSRTPPPSSSQTPTGTPSQTPSRTPSRSVECSLICSCPVFTCHLIYDFDDNDSLFYN